MKLAALRGLQHVVKLKDKRLLPGAHRAHPGAFPTRKGPQKASRTPFDTLITPRLQLL